VPEFAELQAGFKYPPTGSEVMYKAVELACAARREDTCVPAPEAMSDAFQRWKAKNEKQTCKPHVLFWTDDGSYKGLECSSFIPWLRADIVNPVSRPGMMFWQLGHSTVRSVLDNQAELLTSLVDARVRARISGDRTGDVYRETAYEHVQRGRAGVYRVLPKPTQPVKVANIVKGKQRFIFSADLVDVCADRVIFEAQRLHCVANWKSTTKTIGFGLDDESARHVAAVVFGWPSFVDSDASWWDFMVRYFMSKWMARAKTEFYGVPWGSELASAIRSSFEVAASAMFMMPNGAVYIWLYRMGRRSGHLLTGDVNSDERGLLDDLNEVQDHREGGDDNIACPTLSVPTMEARCAEMGFIVEYNPRREDGRFEFCSNLFGPNGNPEPVHWQREVYTLLSKKPSISEFYQLGYVMRHCPAWSKVFSMLRQIGWLGEAVDAEWRRAGVIQPAVRDDQLDQLEATSGLPTYAQEDFAED
jgi:hypothetical protein